MNYIRQFLMILVFTFLGELLKYLLPFPVPASIYGLVCLFAALELKWIRLEQIKETGKFLIEIMPLLFVPAGAGLLDSWKELQPMFVPVVVIMVVSTIVVMIISGRVTQFVIRRKRKNAVSQKTAE